MESSLLCDAPEPVNPIVFDNLNADAIHQAALHTNGAAGLSGLNAYAWSRLCSSFGSTSRNLCSALAAVGRRICITIVHPEGLSAFVACRLIPLDKCPGVRPIGVGEVPIRILAKAACKGCMQAWFADDATSAASCNKLKTWWDDLTVLGSTFGYYPNGSKTHLIVKPEHEETARQLFTDTDVNISIEGKRHLGAALGSRTFTEEYVTNKVQGWTQEITLLAEIASTQPHAAYATFTHGSLAAGPT